MNDQSLEQLFTLASRPKAKTKKADADRVRATIKIMNKASLAAGRNFDRLLDAVEFLNSAN